MATQHTPVEVKLASGGAVDCNTSSISALGYLAYKPGINTTHTSVKHNQIKTCKQRQTKTATARKEREWVVLLPLKEVVFNLQQNNNISTKRTIGLNSTNV
jgi:hypothetical protein